jgi:hypothetical protein
MAHDNSLDQRGDLVEVEIGGMDCNRTVMAQDRLLYRLSNAAVRGSMRDSHAVTMAEKHLLVRWLRNGYSSSPVR